MEIPDCCIRFSKYSPLLGPELDLAAKVIMAECVGLSGKVQVTGYGIITSGFACAGSPLPALLEALRYYHASPFGIYYLWFGDAYTWPDWLKSEMRGFDQVYGKGLFCNAAACLRTAVDALIGGVYDISAIDAALQVARTDQAIKRFMDG